MSSNTQAFFREVLSEDNILSTSQTVNILMAVPLAAGLTLLPNLSALGKVSELAMLILFAAFGVIGAVLISNWSLRPDEMPSINWKQAPMAVSGILYAFEGICIVLPLESTMKERKDFVPVFSLAYSIVTIVYIVIGASCVFVLGSVNEGSITAFLLDNAAKYEGDTLVTFSNLLVSVAVIMTYALTMFPCIELWCQALERKERGDTLESEVDDSDWWGGELAYGPFDTPLLRLSLVAVTVVAAITIPNVRELIGLAGAIAGAATALILPPLICLSFEHRMTWSAMEKYSLLVIGIGFGLFGTVAAVLDIVASFK